MRTALSTKSVAVVAKDRSDSVAARALVLCCMGRQ